VSSTHPAAGSERSSAQRATLSAEGSRPFRWLVRAGFFARGLTYGLIGGLAIALAAGAGSANARPNQQGALSLIAGAPLGKLALVVIAAGLLAYALWKLAQGIIGRGPEGGGGLSFTDRISNLAGGVVYLGFFALAIKILSGSAGNGSSEPQHAASGVLGWPAGRVLVGIAGAGLVAISVYQGYDAVRGGFARDSKLGEMNPNERRVFLALGRVGLIARAAVFALIGYFLIRTAIEFKPSDAIGVDGALAKVHQQTLGPWLLGFVGAGLLIFAAYSFLEGRYRRL
jgi:hypothetical protein